MGVARVAGLVALALAVLFAVFPHTAWKHTAWAWYVTTGFLQTQDQCPAENGVQNWLFNRAETLFVKNAAQQAHKAPKIVELPGKEYSWKRVGEVTDGYMKPVVIRGLFADSPAVQLWSDPEFFAVSYPDATVPVMSPFEPDWATQCSLGLDAWERVPIMDAPHVTFTQMQQWVAEEGRKFKSPLWKPKGVNRTIVADTLPVSRLGDDVPYLTDMLLLFSMPSVGELQLSTDWHCAYSGNLAAHLAGTKTWRILPPAYGHVMRPTIVSHGLGARGNVEDGLLAPGQPLEPMTVTVNPGDMLFLPPWWWHDVSHESRSGQPEFTVLASARLNQHKQAWLAQPYLSLQSYYGFGHLALNKWLGGAAPGYRQTYRDNWKGEKNKGSAAAAEKQSQSQQQ